MLPYYAERFRTVEVNNTFYRMPKDTVLAAWAEAVPPEFRFVLKASQRITHYQRLKEESYDSLAYLLRGAALLGDRLGPILFQLPPNLKKDTDRLSRFLEHLPAGTRSAALSSLMLSAATCSCGIRLSASPPSSATRP